MPTVTTAARLHFGFQNLSLAHERLYGGVGLALDEPRLTVEATRADTVQCDDPATEPYVQRVVDVLDVPGAAVSVEERFPRHVGLGSGTQLSLATLIAVVRAYDRTADARTYAPQLGRGGRSGVGVAAFESGGFIVDGGHPTERFTAEPPAEGDWDVPPVLAHHDVPAHWRFVIVVPDTDPGQSGSAEDQSMRQAVERADPGIADEISTLLTRRVLPAIATRDHDDFGQAAARLGRLNGAWYADEQGGVYRPPAGALVDSLASAPVISGAGQSSWGPTVWGLTTADYESEARDAGVLALDAADVDGTVRVVAPRNTGASLTE
ncbi:MULTISPECIES: beta-ribofuranosylaminobenzene 5'-phosphate synthase family protein [Haloarcula]|uniref:Beta-ribofuranosylaminobenzene 5'-phosphate synthase n=1 Tax=Haloarcula marismortui (strain ATCC 43049 / DSM 3752 / JCM 8966 / VKM B-1809) TaxID=272569 RepID=Q5V544_HALMA|nr:MULTISPECIES: beta-ribofuranosylaminobenzene 5'-phosphate synthase family protein [Haloarcula]AAV45358.1 GHMP kinases putative ATP-binding protein [Haloarcula marismortui ATCC 43049]NHX38785.1 GHMP kinase [Haloarcula sp. R1-2]QCP93136.1 GHMP kinase [Haloarcula marismortui ATCC 43049]